MPVALERPNNAAVVGDTDNAEEKTGMTCES